MVACRLCGNELENLLLIQGMPKTSQNLPTNQYEALATASLDVKQCLSCGLVQLANDPVPYYKDVIRGFTPTLGEKQAIAFEEFIDYFKLKGKRVLEVGSGRGENLLVLKNLDVISSGLEYNPEFVKISKSQGLDVIEGYPLEMPTNLVPYDAFVSINVLEHSPNPRDFLKASSKFLSDGGVGMVSVPDFDFEMKDNFLFSFTRDHLSYFSMRSLSNALSLSGYEVMEVFKNFKLNVITAYFKKQTKINLKNAVDGIISLNHKMGEYINGKKVAVWGASHIAFSIINVLGLKNNVVYIVDSSPAKQGRFSPGSAIPIYSPLHLKIDPVDHVLIMCPEYSDEISKVIKENYPGVTITTFKEGDLITVG